MFALRGIAVSLTFFVLLYCGLSALVAFAWHSVKVLRARERSIARTLFSLRILPIAASVVITLAFVVPSFQMLEPRSMDIDEGMGAIPFALGICALVLIVWGCFRVIVAQTKTTSVVARWLDRAHPLNVDAAAQMVTLRATGDIPPLTLVGVRRPRVLVSESTVALLSRDELRIALKHEFAHMKSRDNLKKLVFRCCPFPGMATLESAWSQAAELAADDAAVSSLDDAVDLAAALVKLSRLVPVEAAPVCTVGFVTGSIGARVARLLAWNERCQSQPHRGRLWYLIPAALAALSCVCVTYGPALVLTHEMTEWLVR
ncbi:MAG TPA: M56 family metallopeptidase [Terriglobales bacterium]|jgi:beta-lactamase regulating signal transducer with metallopeptidase domain|nr:M56 family metallopeptidase [Terriglobales bacterium]